MKTQVSGWERDALRLFGTGFGMDYVYKMQYV